MMPNENVCKNCGHTNSEKFCAQCGQKQNYKYSSKIFFIEAFQDYIGLDGKILRTLKALILKPGKLTIDHFNGKRAHYIKPFQLFLFVNVIFLILAVSRGIYDFTLYEYRTWTPPDTEMVKEMVTESINLQSITYKEYEVKFNNNSDKIRKWIIFLLVPIFALLSWVFQFKKNPYFNQHLILSIHFFTFYWLFVSFIHPIFSGIIESFGLYSDGVMKYISPTINSIYLYFSLQTINVESKKMEFN